MKWVCKDCGESDGFWEEGSVDAWRTLHVEANPDGSYILESFTYGQNSDVLWDTFSDYKYGCSHCGHEWYPFEKGIKLLMDDEKELPEPIPGQQKFE